MSNQLHFRVTLLEDAILASQSGTVGHNPSLAYLSGAVLHGIAANRWYRENRDGADDTGWRLFHSGAVCFSDGLPVLDGEPGYPAPLSLHRPKVRPATHWGEPGERQQIPVRNLAMQADDTPSTMQWEGLTTGHVTDSRIWFQSPASLRMKTAIDPEKGRAAESQLFSYHALDAGQEFVFSVSCTEPHDMESLKSLLEGKARIGRSRTAEYGAVEIKSVALADGGEPKSSRRSDDVLLVWLLSDLAMVNDLGAPTLNPRPEYLGLPESLEFMPGNSFLGTRRYSPFNAKRQCRDPERLVLVRGSVLSFSGAKAYNGHLSGPRVAGLHQEQGLGRMVCNPVLLTVPEVGRTTRF